MRFKPISRLFRTKKIVFALFAVLLLVPGSVIAQTAINYVRTEAESGSLSGGVTIASSSSARSGSYLDFGDNGSGSNDTYENIPSNFNVNDFLDTREIPESMAWEPTGNFRTFCGPSHLGHDDPIVYPGQDNAAHLHQFFGNTLTDHSSTYQSMRTTGESTCEGGKLNRTGYWTPAVFDGQNRVVPPDFILVYYKAQGEGGASTIQADREYIANYSTLPNGLRMIAGAPNGHYEWKCASGGSSSNRIPNCPDNDTVLAVVSFPSCWDGVNLDSANHRSHMAYRNYNNGFGRFECPTTHPMQLPEITEIFHYKNQPGENESTEWKISSDMGATPGSTLHADWFGAWDNGVQERLTQHCIREMRNSNNGNLCDGQALRWGIQGGMGSNRVSGWTPMAN